MAEIIINIRPMSMMSNVIALFTQACYINSDFMSYDEDAKLRFLFNDDAIVSKCAKTCLKIINIRSNVINYVR